MKTVSMSGSARQNVGKKDTKALRREGCVPCVLYGGSEEQIMFSVPEKDFIPLLFTPDTHYVKINIDGKEHNAILQDIQYHPVSDKVLHADFLRIFDDKAITISVPVKTTGTAPGVLQGGKLNVKMRKVKINGLPNNIPQIVEVDISKLGLSQSVKIADIQIPDVTLMEVANSVVVTVKATRNSVAAATEESAE
ncbi:MAG: 50S ribosomal protein L25/general stress protein Ctc [Bacteroidales bacterium]|nr:50S ribosomal protein L25/general stress protein Ctc [Candidatus Scybalousia scybalohippi]MCQ2325928.1 50S ribosomal protein L25/general stress protein Ctc [Bacteroidales bacterium]